MRDFESLKEELELIAFDMGKNGTLYYPKDKSNEIVVTHFNRETPVEFIPIYAEIVKRLQQFIDSKLILSKIIEVIQLNEVGKDFIIRNRFVYVRSIHSYFRDDEDYVVPPPNFDDISGELERLQNSNLSPRDSVLVKILINSFCRSSYTTIPAWERFVCYSPNVAHSLLKKAFGFPDFYGKNVNALIDCLSSLRYPEDGMTAIVLKKDETLNITVRSFPIKNAIMLYHFIISIQSVNQRYKAKDQSPPITVTFI